jgi:hypothetical protein
MGKDRTRLANNSSPRLISDPDRFSPYTICQEENVPRGTILKRGIVGYTAYRDGYFKAGLVYHEFKGFYENVNTFL